MPRDHISIDIPDEWNENIKYGRCWCGKPKTEFDKEQKFFCSGVHALEYSKRVKYWSEVRNEIIQEHGEMCSNCGHTSRTFEISQEKKRKECYEKVAKDYPTAIKQARASMIKDLQEQFEKLASDGYVLENMPFKIADEHFISKNNIYERKWFYLDVDHIKSLALGGEMWDKKNMRVLCNTCLKDKVDDDAKQIKNPHADNRKRMMENDN